MNKKGGVKYLFPWFILLWAIIIIVILAGVLIYYSTQIDIRKEEGEILATRIADCLIDEGRLRENYDSNIFVKCRLDEGVLDQSGLFYVGIFVTNLASGNVEEMQIGDSNLKDQCILKKDEKHFAECGEKVVYALGEDTEFLVKIVTGSNQLGGKL
jgi:hypothetical protein